MRWGPGQWLAALALGSVGADLGAGRCRSVFAPQPAPGARPDFALQARKGWHVPGRRKKTAFFYFISPFLMNKKILFHSNRNLLLYPRAPTAHPGAS